MLGAALSGMRTLFFGILLASASAGAQPAPTAPPAQSPTLSPIVVADLPTACRDFGKLAASPSQAQALSARISLARCLVDEKMKPLALCDCEQSVSEVDAASVLPLALLDEVFTVGDPATKILARQAQGDLIEGLALRLTATVPPAVDTSESAVALHDMRVQMLGTLVSPLFQRARSAYSEVDRLARENPQLAKNPAVLVAVRTSRAKLAQGSSGVAKR
jgi:hypothetical protein